MFGGSCVTTGSSVDHTMLDTLRHTLFGQLNLNFRTAQQLLIAVQVSVVPLSVPVRSISRTLSRIRRRERNHPCICQARRPSSARHVDCMRRVAGRGGLAGPAWGSFRLGHRGKSAPCAWRRQCFGSRMPCNLEAAVDSCCSIGRREVERVAVSSASRVGSGACGCSGAL